MHLFPNSLSTIAIISSLFILELLQACFSCSNNFNLLHSSLESDDITTVFEAPEVETIRPGYLGEVVSVRSRVDFLSRPLTSKCISIAKSYINFSSCKLARPTL